VLGNPLHNTGHSAWPTAKAATLDAINTVGFSKGIQRALSARGSEEAPAASDILSDIAPEKSARIGQRKKADERLRFDEAAESEGLG
jgi:hypothetical protein